MANEATPYFDPADVTTGYCEAAVTGKRFVAISGPRVDGLVQISPSTANGAAYGVAMRDAAIGAKVGIAHVGVWPVTALGAVTAGDRIAVGTGGTAKLAASGHVVVGIALDDAADGADVPVRLSVASGAVLA
jgi:predicted RecA/RadA family phage recombinase